MHLYCIFYLGYIWLSFRRFDIKNVLSSCLLQVYDKKEIEAFIAYEFVDHFFFLAEGRRFNDQIQCKFCSWKICPMI